jgi:hypothetical protein
VTSDLELTNKHQNRKKILIKNFCLFFAFLIKTSFLKNFRKKKKIFFSKVSKGTQADDCASNSTKIITVASWVREIQQVVLTAEYKGSSPAKLLFLQT